MSKKPDILQGFDAYTLFFIAEPRIKKGNYQTYWWVIGILTFLLVVVTCILTVTIYVTRKRRRELRERRTLEPEHRETDASLASEALLCDGMNHFAF